MSKNFQDGKTFGVHHSKLKKKAWTKTWTFKIKRFLHTFLKNFQTNCIILLRSLIKLEDIYLLTLTNSAINSFNYITFLSILPELLKLTSSFDFAQHKHNAFNFQPPEFNFHVGIRELNYLKGKMLGNAII